jgi:ubiquinone/menaquinone biosynthesis C-methylase UbiE
MLAGRCTTGANIQDMSCPSPHGRRNLRTARSFQHGYPRGNIPCGKRASQKLRLLTKPQPLGELWSIIAARWSLVTMDNYEFCASYAASRLPKGAKVLDYGCGRGTVVKLLRDRGLDAMGCDVFFEGGDYSSEVDPELSGKAVLRMKDGKIPFPADTFDMIVNNQVLEHVEDIDTALGEMARVLKPGGAVLSLFPDKSVWREGHCGVPFLHWFPKRSRFRVHYAHLMRLLGRGYFTENKTPRQWAEEFCTWLDKWTYYRSYKEIETAFARHLSRPRHLESYWLETRLGRKIRIVPQSLAALFVRKFGCLVFEAHKPAS